MKASWYFFSVWTRTLESSSRRQIASPNNRLFISPPFPFFWLLPTLLFAISLFPFPGASQTLEGAWLACPLIGIRFTGLDRRGRCPVPKRAHICLKGSGGGCSPRSPGWVQEFLARCRPSTTRPTPRRVTSVGGGRGGGGGACSRARMQRSERTHVWRFFMCEPNSDQRASVLTAFTVC